tara:strand:- start:79 stop:1017 length:939 start_codon:yes stop_codon:yes gene_type:complete
MENRKNTPKTSFHNCTVIIPTFLPGNEIIDNIRSLPKDIEVLIVDNSYDDRLSNQISVFPNCRYFNIGDVGLGKTFNYALKQIKTEFVLITQPDVVLRSNCLKNLIAGINKYPNSAVAVPVVYDLGIYSQYDFYDLKYCKNKKKFNNKKLKSKINTIPSGDFCVDAVNATTMLIKTEVIKKIGGWDDNIYVYLEDIDICLRLYLSGHTIVKISDAVVDHKGWSSHFAQIKDTMNITRIWHFTWSSIYFNLKFTNKSAAYCFLTNVMLKSIVKLSFNFFLSKKKYLVNKTKLSACSAIIFNKGSYFRLKHKVD